MVSNLLETSLTKLNRNKDGACGSLQYLEERKKSRTNDRAQGPDDNQRTTNNSVVDLIPLNGSWLSLMLNSCQKYLPHLEKSAFSSQNASGKG